MSSSLNSKPSAFKTFNPNFFSALSEKAASSWQYLFASFHSASCVCRCISLSINTLKWWCSPLSLPASGLAGTSPCSGCLEGRTQERRRSILGLEVPSRGCAPYTGVTRSSRRSMHVWQHLLCLLWVGACRCGVSRASLRNNQVFPECFF